MKRIPLLVTTLLLSVALHTAQAVSWKMDKSHSQVTFTVSHLVIAEVAGVFKDFDVTFASEKPDFTDAKIEAAIKTGSIDTGNENRDKHVRSNDFLNAEKFPDMKFKTARIEKTGDNAYKITGDLTIRDITKTVVLDTRFKGTVKDPWGNERIAFKATATVDRFEFGTTWDKAIEAGGLVAGKEVHIVLLMEFIKQK